ncbi:MAG: FAD-dependent oxidoreductase [Betaproteobacteria bacterium]
MNTQAYRQYICRACGHVYDEAAGDPDGGLPPGTRLEQIPDDWACPLCGVTKADFEPYEPVVPQACRASGPAAQRHRARGAEAGVVIVGGGTAAWTLVEHIRALDAHKPITLLSTCLADRYDKPRLSVAFKQGATAQSLPMESGLAAAERLGVKLRSSTTAVGVNLEARRLRTTRGTLRFDDLVLAHGAVAQACDGLPAELTWRINDLGAYAGLRQALARGGQTGGKARVVIVGAGLVGCELANDLALAGHPVVLLDKSPRPLPMATAKQSADLLQAWKALPLEFIGDAEVKSCFGKAHGSTASPASSAGVELILHSGHMVQAEVLISAVGLGTPSRLAHQAGLRWDKGIAVDSQTLETGVAHVHALGDCISINGRPQRFIEPIRRQARVVAARVCGMPTPAYDSSMPPIRVKTSSLPLTLAA